MIHRTETGHIPAAQIFAWACTCGASEVKDYDRGWDATLALRLAAYRAGCHADEAVREWFATTEEDM